MQVKWNTESMKMAKAVQESMISSIILYSYVHSSLMLIKMVFPVVDGENGLQQRLIFFLISAQFGHETFGKITCVYIDL